jgi:hypothetical protein
MDAPPSVGVISRISAIAEVTSHSSRKKRFTAKGLQEPVKEEEEEAKSKDGKTIKSVGDLAKVFLKVFLYLWCNAVLVSFIFNADTYSFN